MQLTDHIIKKLQLPDKKSLMKLRLDSDKGRKAITILTENVNTKYQGHLLREYCDTVEFLKLKSRRIDNYAGNLKDKIDVTSLNLDAEHPENGIKTLDDCLISANTRLRLCVAPQPDNTKSVILAEEKEEIITTLGAYLTPKPIRRLRVNPELDIETTLCYMNCETALAGHEIFLKDHESGMSAGKYGTSRGTNGLIMLKSPEGVMFIGSKEDIMNGAYMLAVKCEADKEILVKLNPENVLAKIEKQKKIFEEYLLAIRPESNGLFLDFGEVLVSVPIGETKKVQECRSSPFVIPVDKGRSLHTERNEYDQKITVCRYEKGTQSNPSHTKFSELWSKMNQHAPLNNIFL